MSSKGLRQRQGQGQGQRVRSYANALVQRVNLMISFASDTEKELCVPVCIRCREVIGRRRGLQSLNLYVRVALQLQNFAFTVFSIRKQQLHCAPPKKKLLLLFYDGVSFLINVLVGSFLWSAGKPNRNQPSGSPCTVRPPQIVGPSTYEPYSRSRSRYINEGSGWPCKYTSPTHAHF